MPERQHPHISVVTWSAGAAGDLTSTGASLLEQRESSWEWLVFGVSGTVETLSDPRVQQFEHMSDVTRACEEVAAGEHLLVLPAGATLSPDALERVLAALAQEPDADLLYPDHDVLGVDGDPVDPQHKVAWSPERLRHVDYVGPVVVVRRELVAAVGGPIPELGGASTYDLVLRASERARAVIHLGHVIAHVPAAPLVRTSSTHVRAVQEHLDRVGLRAQARAADDPGVIDVVREPDLTTPVSVIIPTIGTRGVVGGFERTMVTETIRSFAQRTHHQDVEFVVVYDEPTPASVLEELRDLRSALGLNLKLIVFTDPFSFSEKCNVGAGHADGAVLLFANDDMEAISEGTIERLITPLREEGVGATGPKLRFEDGRIQCAGIQYGSGKVRNSYRLAAGYDRGTASELVVSRETSGLTGACIAIRPEVFESVGGFSEAFPVNFNDVDLGLKILRQGLRLVWLHDVELFHFESVTRDPTVHDWEHRLLTHRWGDVRVAKERYSWGVR